MAERTGLDGWAAGRGGRGGQKYLPEGSRCPGVAVKLIVDGASRQCDRPELPGLACVWLIIRLCGGEGGKGKSWVRRDAQSHDEPARRKPSQDSQKPTSPEAQKPALPCRDPGPIRLEIARQAVLGWAGWAGAGAWLGRRLSTLHSLPHVGRLAAEPSRDWKRGDDASGDGGDETRSVVLDAKAAFGRAMIDSATQNSR